MYSVKQIEVHIALAVGTFGGRGTEKIISGLPISVDISKPGGADKSSARITIGGMSYSDMEQLTTLSFRPLRSARNAISIYAGDSSGMAMVFSGEISSAFADFNRAPDVVFNIEALSGYYPALMATGPSAVRDQISAADFIAQQAHAAGYEFENHGVTTTIRDCIFSGSPVQQARMCAAQIGATLLIDDNSFVLMPPGRTRGGSTVVLSPSSGLLGYPAFNADGIEVIAIFNPAFSLGGTIEVDSVVPRASGLWQIVRLDHKLSANTPGNGTWESRIMATYLSNSTANTTAGTV